jgi:hypothetical protein
MAMNLTTTSQTNLSAGMQPSEDHRRSSFSHHIPSGVLPEEMAEIRAPSTAFCGRAAIVDGRVHFCARTVRDADWSDGPRPSVPETVRLCRTGETVFVVN